MQPVPNEDPQQEEKAVNTVKNTLFHHPSISARKKTCEKLGLAVYGIPVLPLTSKPTPPSAVQECKGDGNCYFRAIAFLVSGMKCIRKF